MGSAWLEGGVCQGWQAVSCIEGRKGGLKEWAENV